MNVGYQILNKFHYNTVKSRKFSAKLKNFPVTRIPGYPLSASLPLTMCHVLNVKDWKERNIVLRKTALHQNFEIFWKCWNSGQDAWGTDPGTIQVKASAKTKIKQTLIIPTILYRTRVFQYDRASRLESYLFSTSLLFSILQYQYEWWIYIE